jgi:hypothetical protein
MVPPTPLVQVQARNAGDALTWDLHGLRGYQQAETLVLDVATRLPFFVPRSDLLLLDWQAAYQDESMLRVRPRLDMHAQPWLEIPTAAVRPTGAMVQVRDAGGDRQLFLQMPRRAGRAGARVPLSTGLMRMSMQAHDDHARFLPVVLRSDLSEDRQGTVTLHLHSLDMKELLSRRALEPHMAKTLAGSIAGRVLELMSLQGAGLARDVPMLIGTGEAGNDA